MKNVYFFLFLIALFSCSSKTSRPPGIIEKDNKMTLAPCPDLSNCVVSFSYDEKHFIQPFKTSMPMSEAYKRILKILNAQKEIVLVEKRDHYLYAQYESSLFRFTDHVEFLFPREGDIIHVRSASEKGAYDFGVNRKRVEMLRFNFAQD